jgi:hypothetical protein
MEASLLKAIRRDFYQLADKGENIFGYRKEIDHELNRIAAIEKSLGIRNNHTTISSNVKLAGYQQVCVPGARHIQYPIGPDPAALSLG